MIEIDCKPIAEDGEVKYEITRVHAFRREELPAKYLQYGSGDVVYFLDHQDDLDLAEHFERLLNRGYSGADAAKGCRTLTVRGTGEESGTTRKWWGKLVHHMGSPGPRFELRRGRKLTKKELAEVIKMCHSAGKRLRDINIEQCKAIGEAAKTRKVEVRI